jgi:hypothetical protein
VCGERGALSDFESLPRGAENWRRKRMKKSIKHLLAISLLGLICSGFGATLMLGKAEYTKKEKTPCTTCHVKAGSKELNDVGKCYAKDHSLKDCKDASAKSSK